MKIRALVIDLETVTVKNAVLQWHLLRSLLQNLIKDNLCQQLKKTEY